MLLVFSVSPDMFVAYMKVFAEKLAGFGRLTTPAIRVVKTTGAMVNFMVTSGSRSVCLSSRL